MIEILVALFVCTCVQAEFEVSREGYIPVEAGFLFGDSMEFESTLLVGCVTGLARFYDWIETCEYFVERSTADTGGSYYADVAIDINAGLAMIPRPFFGAGGKVFGYSRNVDDTWENTSETIITKTYGERIAYEFPYAVLTSFPVSQIGSASVYKIPENVFVQQLNPSFTTFNLYGRSVAMANGVLAIGSEYYVYIYKLEGATFTQFQVVNGVVSYYGRSVAINDKYLAVGDFDDVRIYEPIGENGRYVQTGILKPAVDGNSFGNNLAIYDNVVIVSSNTRIEIHYKFQDQWIRAHTKEDYNHNVAIWNGVAVASRSTTNDLYYVHFCAPQCGDCGDDGCGGICGTCDEHSTCESGTCVNINECEGCNFCRDRECFDFDDGYVCNADCPDGYYPEGDYICLDINECEDGSNNCIDGFECVNTQGSFVCLDLCLNADLNYDFCNFGDCDTDLRGCSNLQDGLICDDCPSGYTNDGNECADVNECELGTHQCSGLRNCTNIPGGYTCSDCPVGYTNYKKFGCTDINECTILGSCSSAQECINLPGSWACGRCLDGFTDSNGTCVDINECEFEYLNKCQRPRVCQNTAGSYTCSACPSNVEALDDFTCEGQVLGILGLHGVAGSTIILIILSLLTGIFTFVSIGLVFYKFILPQLLETKNEKIERGREEKYKEKF